MEEETAGEGGGALEDQAGVVDADPRLILERVDSWVDGFVRLLPNIMVALVLIVLVWFAARAVGWAIRRSATRGSVRISVYLTQPMRVSDTVTH